MTAKEIRHQLEHIALAEDFAFQSSLLADEWTSAGVGFDSIDLILQFMERNPSIDYGSPGPLTHYMEKFYGKGYEEKLVESVNRHPTQQTVWLLNRIINGCKDSGQRQHLVQTMEQACSNPRADSGCVAQTKHFLARLRYFS